MLTEFGKMCNKITFDAMETTTDMASHLGLTASYLSGVFHGRKHIPDSLSERIRDIYKLTDDEYEKLKNAAVLSNSTIKMTLVDRTPLDRKLIHQFVQHFDELTPAEKRSISKIVDKDARQ